MDLGLRTDHVLSARVSLTSDRYREDAAAAEIVRRLVERAGRPEFKPEERVEVFRQLPDSTDS